MARPLNLRERGRWAEALDEARRTGDRVEEARALVLLGHVAESLSVAPPGVARAEALLAAGRPAEALAECQGDDLGAQVARVHVRVALGEPAEALVLAARALASVGTPFDEAQARLALAAAHHACGHLDEAVDAWEAAVVALLAIDRAHPELARAWEGLGNTYRKAGDVREALRWLRAALDAGGDRADARAATLHAMAQCLRRSGDFAGARDALRVSLALSERLYGDDHPDVEVTRFELARVEVDCGDFDGLQRMQDARDRLAARLGADHPTVRAMDAWL